MKYKETKLTLLIVKTDNEIKAIEEENKNMSNQTKK